MTVILSPAYMKPRIKVLSWTIPLAYVTETKTEAPIEPPIVKPIIKEHTIAWNSYYNLGFGLDLSGRSTREKVVARPESKFLMPVEEFVKIATEEQEICRVKGKFNLLNDTGIDLVTQVYKNARNVIKHEIANPLQWIVYIPSQKILTRLCWLIQIEGEVIVRPFGERNLLLEIENVVFDKVNQVDLHALKTNIVKKERIIKIWQTLLAKETVEEETQTALLELGAVSEETKGEQVVEEKPAELKEIE